MNDLLKITTLVLTIAISLTACKKEEVGDIKGPKIIINAPMNQASHMSGDMLHIDVDFEDEDEIHEIKAYLITTHMNMVDTVKEMHAHPDAKTYSMMEHYTIGTVMHTDFSLQVTATDHSGNKNTESTGFHVMQ